ncbi:hypothetical protein SCACP_34640 [Sporomusa carbonis]|uniref:flavodoxin family protein n=1 Tax=Sporomusa carbonis TaxID=3076075 RepID=UPI003A71D79E
MKKVVAFIGSPRKNGNTSTLVEEMAKGAKAAGSGVKIYRLHDMNIKPCQSCFYCRGVENCAIKDDMQAVYEDIKQAGAVIIGSPVYMFQVTAQTKLLLDRLFPLMDANFNPRFGTKKTVMVYAQGNPDPDAFKASFEANATVLKIMGLNVVDTIITASANDPQTSCSNADLMAKAFQTGKALVE